MELNYSDLGLKMDTSSIVFKFNGKEIELFRYLPLEYKYDLIMCSLHDSEEDGIFNELKLDAYFNLNAFLSYVKNINFTQAEMADKLKLYNEIKSSGLLDEFLKNVDARDYNICFDGMCGAREDIMKYRNTAGAALQAIIRELPQITEKAAKIVDEMGPEKVAKIENIANLFKQGQIDGQPLTLAGIKAEENTK